MHKHKLPKILIIVGVLLSVLLTHFLSFASAETGTIALSSSASSVTVGNTFVVTVTANTDAAVTIAQSRLTYNPGAVVVENVDYAGSPFNNDTPDASSGSGYVLMSRYKGAPPFPNGSSLVAKITFRAIKDSGDAGISTVKADSALYSASTATDILSSTGGVSVALKAVPTAPPTENPTSPDPKDTTPGATTPAPTNTGDGGGDGTTTTPADGTTTLPDGTVGTQPGSISDPLEGPTEVIAKKSGVDGLSITKYRSATIGVTVAILIGAAAYGFFFLKKRGTFAHHVPSPESANAVVFNGQEHIAPAASPIKPTTPSNIITPQNKDKQ